MNDSSALLFLLIAALALLWFFVWGPQAKQVRVERERHTAKARAAKERLDAETRARREAERSRLEAEREALLKKIRTSAPDFILKARLEFEREYKSKGGEGIFGQEMSPLVCFGYRVGKTAGRTENERHSILEYAMAADYDTTLPFLPASYRNDWGTPLSATRFNRIHQHLKNMADLRDGRRNFEFAVTHWRADASWLHKEQRSRVDRYHGMYALSPGTQRIDR